MAKWTLFDKVIHVSLYHIDKDPETGEVRPDSSNAITIRCPDGGYKPAMSVSYKMVPGNICYQVTLRITNFSLRGIVNIRDKNVMAIDVGYRTTGDTEHIQSFVGPIFSSYQESPNPDGVTVFEGVVTGEVGQSLLNDRPYLIKFNKTTVTVGELCTTIANVLNLDLNKEHPEVSDELWNMELSVRKSVFRASNGLSVLNWLNSSLKSLCQTLYGTEDKEDGDVADTNPYGVFIIWDQGKLLIIQTGLTNDQVKKYKDAVVDLHMVKSASFTGPELKADALFNPAIKPGTIIHMDPVYFTGGANMPNTMTEDIFNPDEGYYRVITMAVEFDTTGTTNNMSLAAVPLRDNPKDIEKEKYREEVEKRTAAVENIERQKREEQALDIVFGEEEKPEQVDVPPADLWSVNYRSSSNAVQYTIKPGQTLSQIAEEAWGSDKFILPDSKMDVPEGESFHRAFSDGVPIWYFFPLIQLDTYKAMEANKNADYNPYYIDINNPDMLRADKTVSIPELTLDTVKEHIGDNIWIQIFDLTEQYYKSVEKPEWASAMRDIQCYLKWGLK